ncbi:tripartite tricarboxylate transporter substrate binding protein [Pseudalkalibacillus decolorationis]|uniref:tripartite tricarboxylate transporter substrate binding protein n=1 Tax=Pseudalkalibacillus decolorationis TaxID=163879 RepID=UPI0021485FF2|nr:tripartite tricarboxylate transporter substrate binding protein [Pseudalkalibacillus decolorationis]
MKKLFSFVLVLLLVAGALAACSSQESASSKSTSGESSGTSENDDGKFPNKPINVIVAYDAGGGTDTTARTLQPYLEKELGVPVNVINKPGGSGWVGWTEIANAEPDGYTIGYLNSPNFASGLVNPTMQRGIDLDSFTILANHVADPGAIVIRADEDRFTNFKELIDYAKKHELTTTATGVAGDDHLVTLKLNQKLDTKFRAIQFEGTAESRSSFLGGHVDVLITSVGEAYSMHQNNQLKVVAITAKEKSSFLSDVPTVKEAGFDEIISQSTRGLVAPKGLPEEKVEILQDALEKAINNTEHQKKMKELGTQVLYANGDEYLKLLQQDIEDVKGLKDLLGW